MISGLIKVKLQERCRDKNLRITCSVLVNPDSYLSSRDSRSAVSSAGGGLGGGGGFSRRSFTQQLSAVQSSGG